MTNLQQHHDRLDYIAKDYWRQYEHPADHAWRVEAAEAEAGSFFARATAGQREAYINATAGLAGLHAPFDNRRRDRAKATWYATTGAARALFEASFEELMRSGEISEKTLNLWDELETLQKMESAA